VEVRGVSHAAAVNILTLKVIASVMPVPMPMHVAKFIITPNSSGPSVRRLVPL
jgi:hypothetical protein